MNATPFECAMCGNCCRGDGYVRVDREEIALISAYLGIDPATFVNTCTRVPQIDEQAKAGFRWLVDKADIRECVFLTPEGCAINPVKPRRCREFPFRWRTPDVLEYCEGMRSSG